MLLDPFHVQYECVDRVLQQVELLDRQVLQVFEVVFDGVDQPVDRPLQGSHEVAGDGRDDDAEKNHRTDDDPGTADQL